ncbi:MAG: hypothetical protein MMC23_000563 [Stictis urceolatum]|nr:hypothetical protein [Stictis urceolata]
MSTFQLLLILSADIFHDTIATNQLLNPKLVPKLSSDVPNDLLRKKGVADEELAKIERGRAVNGDRSPSASPSRPSRKRSRSPSSSGSSVSTISTNLSREATPKLKRAYTDDFDKPLFSQQESQIPSIARKRQRSSSSDSSRSSYSRRQHTKEPASYYEERNTRRRRASTSPDSRGRKSRHEESSLKRRERSRDTSMDRSQIARNRYSLTPDGTHGRDHRRNDVEGLREHDGRSNGYASQRDEDRRAPHGRRPRASRDDAFGGTRRAEPPRERSMSPYSKRMALTQAMGIGR